MQPTPVRDRSERRDAIDVARSLALLVVVFGHLSMAVIDHHGGRLRGANLFALYPAWSWLAVAAPMPVFFAAAGWANATSTLAGAASRLRTLVGLAAVVVAAWSAPVIVATLIGGHPGALGAGARLATQPLWFLAAYLPLAAMGGSLARVAARRPVRAIGGAIAALALLDFVRFGRGGPAWIGWLGFLVAWAVPWMLGAWWRANAGSDARTRPDRSSLRIRSEKGVGLALLVGFGAAGAALVAFGGYQPSLIDVVVGGRSNTSPPTLYTAVIAVAQVGALMLAARALDRLGRRYRRVFDGLSTAAVGVYVWHLTALALASVLVALGVFAPRRLTVTWWLTRPAWCALVLAITAAFVSLTACVRGRLAKRTRGRAPKNATAAIAGVAIAAIAAAIVGLKGPSTLPCACVCTALLTTAWLLLRDSGAATQTSRDPRAAKRRCPGSFRVLRRGYRNPVSSRRCGCGCTHNPRRCRCSGCSGCCRGGPGWSSIR